MIRRSGRSARKITESTWNTVMKPEHGRLLCDHAIERGVGSFGGAGGPVDFRGALRTFQHPLRAEVVLGDVRAQRVGVFAADPLEHRGDAAGRWNQVTG